MSAKRKAEVNRPASRGVVEERASAEEAYDAFVKERYAQVVSAVRLIVTDYATAQDVAQEAFARAYISWRKLWPDGNPGGWIHKVATNLALSLRRRAARELRAVTRLSKRSDLVVNQPDAHPELQRAVAALPKRQRTAIALHYVLGLSMDECGEVMGCPSGTVKSILHAARGKLREDLGEDE